MTDFRALCVELTDCLEKADWPHRYKAVFQQWTDIAHAALAESDGSAVSDGREPASVVLQPSDEDLLRVAAIAIDPYESSGIAFGEYEAETESAVEAYGSELIAYARAVLARWGRPASQPAAVSERLPGPEDCDEQGLCWLWERDCGYTGRKWALVDRAWSLSQTDEDLSVYTHWLSANALPTPDAQ